MTTIELTSVVYWRALENAYYISSFNFLGPPNLGSINLSLSFQEKKSTSPLMERAEPAEFRRFRTKGFLRTVSGRTFVNVNLQRKIIHKLSKIISMFWGYLNYLQIG